jgi:phage/plasmid-like protein (TIGR03299 family)
MAHELEITAKGAAMAYVGEEPWHGLGKRVPADLSPIQMLEAADLNWSVKKHPAFATVAGKRVNIGWSALVRDSDESILSVVSNDWNPVQNTEAFEFFNDFVSAGDMEMHTAGSLRDGQIVWALAKVKESFELFKGDRVDSFMLFTNPHKFGQSIDVRFTPIRVVCNNTLTLALGTNAQRMVKVTHRREFDPDAVKEMLGIASHKLAKYKEMATFLGSKKYKNETIKEYFSRVFPVLTTKEVSEKEMSKSAALAMETVTTQPGAEFAKGSWWQAFNAVTYLVDHKIGKTDDTRLASAWFGQNKERKLKALELAVEYAEAV